MIQEIFSISWSHPYKGGSVSNSSLVFTFIKPSLESYHGVSLIDPTVSCSVSNSSILLVEGIAWLLSNQDLICNKWPVPDQVHVQLIKGSLELLTYETNAHNIAEASTRTFCRLCTVLPPAITGHLSHFHPTYFPYISLSISDHILSFVCVLQSDSSKRSTWLSHDCINRPPMTVFCCVSPMSWLSISTGPPLPYIPLLPHPIDHLTCWM